MDDVVPGAARRGIVSVYGSYTLCADVYDPYTVGMTARIIVNTRLSEDGVAQIDALAEREDRTRSDMIRILLKEALIARQRRNSNK